MVASAGPDPDRPVEYTRPDQPLPRRDAAAPTPSPASAEADAEAAEDADIDTDTIPEAEAEAESEDEADADATPTEDGVPGTAEDLVTVPGTTEDPVTIPAPTVSPEDTTDAYSPPPAAAAPEPVATTAFSSQFPPVQPPVQGGGIAPKAPAPPANWHRFHYPVAAFLIAYGLTVLLTAALAWGDRREELEGYLSAGVASPALVAAKVAEAALVAVAAAAAVRRRDLWLVPALAGWMAGFAMFSVLDVFDGRWTGLLEHVAYLAVFVALLFLSYGLSAKVQVARAAKAEPGGTGRSGLSRTQELALAAINRWQPERGRAAPPRS